MNAHLIAQMKHIQDLQVSLKVSDRVAKYCANEIDVSSGNVREYYVNLFVDVLRQKDEIIKLIPEAESHLEMLRTLYETSHLTGRPKS